MGLKKMSNSNAKFCWLCGNKLYGNHKEELAIDGYPTVLHKSCAKDVKKEWDFRKQQDGSYVSMVWTTESPEDFN